jgi:hypothetical protein
VETEPLIFTTAAWSVATSSVTYARMAASRSAAPSTKMARTHRILPASVKSSRARRPRLSPERCT